MSGTKPETKIDLRGRQASKERYHAQIPMSEMPERTDDKFEQSECTIKPAAGRRSDNVYLPP
ncbi:hypothetical protein NXC24_PB00062 (plasmid) [Rhizobium sp. NXC24]|nr:hypothetical protein NXC24_PB00062 [Rhizobium sp. NXC24]